jgi:hypothetical protein
MGAPSSAASRSRVLHVVVLADDLVCDEIHQQVATGFSIPKDEQPEVIAWLVCGALLGGLVGWMFAAELFAVDVRTGAYSLALSSFGQGALVGVPLALLVMAIGMRVYASRAQPRTHRAISVGSSVANDIVLFGVGAPVQHTLFDHRQGAYFLDLPSHTHGKISLGRRTVTVEQLRRRFGRGDKLRIRLDPRAKGKLKVGDSTILFQFAPPRPATVRLPFPLDLRPTLEQMLSRRDQLSLAASVGILGSYFFWVSTTEVDHTFDPDDIDERFVKAMGIVKRPDEPEKKETEEDELAQEDEEKPEEKKDEPKPEPKLDKKLDSKPQKFSEQAVKQARNVGIARVLGTYGGPGEGTVLDVIESTENNLGDLFAQGMTTTMLADGGDITPFVPGGEGISLRGTAVETTGLTTAEGPELDKRNDKMERKINARTKASKTDVFGDVDKNALKAYINRRTSALRSCYEKALRTQPDLAGKMSYVIDISMMGNVTGVRVTEDTLGVSSVRVCTEAKIKGWRFPKGEDTAEISFSVVFSGG